MKVCIVTGDIGAVSETFVQRHIVALAPENTVVMYSKGEPDATLKAPAFKIPPPIFSHTFLPLWMLASVLRLLFRGHPNAPSRKVSRQIHTFLATHQVDVVLAEFGTIGNALQQVIHAAGVPLFVYFRGMDASSALRKWYEVHAYRRRIPKVAGVFCVSRYVRDRLAACGITNSNMHIVPSGVDVSQFVPGVQRKDGLVLTVGRFTSKKAPITVIKSFSQIARMYPQARLEMVGDGPLLPSCQRLVDEMDLGDKVHFHGARDASFIAAKMQVSSVFVQHSVTAANGDSEGLPSAIQEAMASGLPVVATRHAGIPEAVIDGQTGLLVPEHDEQATAKALELLLGDPLRRQVMGETARLIAVRDFDAQAQLQKVRGILVEGVGLKMS